MTIVPVGHLIGLVSYVRGCIIHSYQVDMDAVRVFKDDAREIDWAVPLKRERPNAPISKKECGAFRYFLRHGDENNEWEQGEAYAWFELLPCMPESLDDLGLCGQVKPLASIGAGKSNRGDVGHFGRYSFVSLALSDVRWFEHLHLLPVALDMVNRFSRQLAADLPADLEWREDLSHLIRAA